MILNHSHSIPDNYLDLIVYTPMRKASAMHCDKPGSLSFGRTNLHDLHLRRWRLMMKSCVFGYEMGGYEAQLHERRSVLSASL